MCEIIIAFFIYSVLGWLCESVWHFLWHGKYEQRKQLLTLPLCPVYGFGGILLGNFVGTDCGILTVAASGALLASAAELLWYIAFVKIFGVRLWDYSGFYLNLFGGVCGVYTLLWGLLGAAFAELINPAVMGFVEQIPADEKFFTAVFLGIITAADMRKTASVLLDYKCGNISVLPPCFGYMKKNL